MYGKELILDIHECDVSKFNRKDIEIYLKNLCELISMSREDLYFWDYKGDPAGYEKAPDHLKGVSCIQFITTSNITIHALDVLKKIFINIFSCKNFDSKIARDFTRDYFDGIVFNRCEVERE